MTQRPTQRTTYGFLSALAGFIMWGLLPLYWKLVVGVDPLEILCHRIIWSLVFIAAILTLRSRWSEVFGPMREPRNLAILSLSSLCIGGNWLLYIWAVTTNHVLETSLGYYITPLVNTVFGFLFFRERLTPMQYIAIGLAALGVMNSIVNLGELPWISLVLAFSFAFYGLLRKIATVESLPGLFLETMVLIPAAFGYLIYLFNTGQNGFLAGPIRIDMLLVGAGVVTAMPLIAFAYGARRLQLTTLGVLQFVAPSIAFLLGVFVFNEPFSTTHLITFACIWTGLAVYTADSIRTIRRHRRATR